MTSFLWSIRASVDHEKMSYYTQAKTQQRCDVKLSLISNLMWEPPVTTLPVRLLFPQCPHWSNNSHFDPRSLPSSSGLASELSTSEASQKNSKQSQRSNSVNPDELANQVLEIDDPSQTLASSLHAVDIPSFVDSPSGVTSPSPNDRAERGGMETSFTSPVLGN